MWNHRLISIFYNRPKQMFLPVVSSSVLKRFSVYFSKVEEVSASVRDSRSMLPTPQAKFPKKQFYQS